MPLPFRRVVWIVLDSVGIGEMPDAAAWGDAGSDTLGNICKQRPLHVPNFERLGLANIRPLTGLHAAEHPEAAYGRCTLASPGKDTTTGHWEMVGIHLQKPFPTFLKGFPPEIIEAFEQAIGRKSLGNKAASGTEIIQELGEEHMRTGSPIVYTSADSVFQIAAHEEIIPVPELYRICDIARELLRGPNEVGRVIARPFIGTPGHFTRTANRHDYAVPPPPGMLLDQLSGHGIPIHSIGKIYDVFLGRGIATQVKTKSNAEGMQRVLDSMAEHPDGVIYANFVDFDMLYGHRNDVEGYARALEETDQWLPQFRALLKPDDLAILTADHGCDPTTPSTDHSREYVPVLALGGKPVNLGTRSTLADMGQTIAENFGVTIPVGTSFLRQIA